MTNILTGPAPKQLSKLDLIDLRLLSVQKSLESLKATSKGTGAVESAALNNLEDAMQMLNQLRYEEQNAA